MSKYINGKDEVMSKIMDITPDMARKWLDAVPEYQRKIKPRQVRKLLLAIQRKEWRLNGAAIVFNEKGDLIDGQHRLTAITMSGQTVPSLVVTGISKDELTFATLGDVAPRLTSDFIHTRNPVTVASALRIIWFIENRLFPDVHSTGSGKQDEPTPPVPEVVKLARKWAEPLADLVIPLREASKVTGQGSFLMALMWYFQNNRPRAELNLVAEFFARVGDGVGLGVHHAAYQLRKRFQDRSRGVSIIPISIRRGMILKALNYHLDGKPVERISWDPDREAFPPLRGYERPPDKRKEVNPSAEARPSA